MNTNERPTPETDAVTVNIQPEHASVICSTVPASFARCLERERDEAREAFAIATDQLVQAQGELRQVREENARLRAKMTWLAGQLTDHPCACQWLDDTISELFTP